MENSLNSPVAPPKAIYQHRLRRSARLARRPMRSIDPHSGGPHLPNTPRVLPSTLHTCAAPLVHKRLPEDVFRIHGGPIWRQGRVAGEPANLPSMRNMQTCWSSAPPLRGGRREHISKFDCQLAPRRTRRGTEPARHAGKCSKHVRGGIWNDFWAPGAKPDWTTFGQLRSTSGHFCPASAMCGPSLVKSGPKLADVGPKWPQIWPMFGPKVGRVSWVRNRPNFGRSLAV